jgi:hypothetical protein
MEAIAYSPTNFGVFHTMARLAALAVASLIGLTLAGCSGGSLGQTGVSLPLAGDGVQTVSDAADALDSHRSSASASAKSAIAVTDAFGSYVRDISAMQRSIVGSRHASKSAQTRRVVSRSALVIRPAAGYVTEYCQGTAGYSASGIPSLDATFGWESGAFSGGSRTLDDRGSAIWTADATGAVVRGAIGSLSLARSGSRATCPMTVPVFVVKGGESASAFSIPIAMSFRRGELANLSVGGARFSSGEGLYATTVANRSRSAISGTITNDRTQVATFRTNMLGSGTLTITSTGAQYVIADWIVVGT